MKSEYFWILLSILCIAYGIAVLSTGSGSGFWLFWLAAGLSAAVLAFCAHAGIWALLPVRIRACFLAFVLICAALFAAVEIQILRQFNAAPSPGADWLIVLGAQVRTDGPSVTLQYRLDAAYDYLAQNPGTRCIVSGGQGTNEPCTEASGMKDYLAAKGIPEERIFMEEASTNTAENLAFSLALTGPDKSPLIDPHSDHTVIVTNNFHVLRGCLIARKAGLINLSGLPARSDRVFLLNNLVREFFGLIKDKLVGNI